MDKPDMILPVAQVAPAGPVVAFAIASFKDAANVFTVARSAQVWDVFVDEAHRRAAWPRP